jgi:hypothetical protein
VKRRKVLALLAGAAVPPPLAASAAEKPTKPFRLGVLAPLPPGPGIHALEQRLLMLGWEEGRNLQID